MQKKTLELKKDQEHMFHLQSVLHYNPTQTWWAMV